MQHVKNSKKTNPIPPFLQASFLKFATIPRDRKWHISKLATLPRAPYQPHAKNNLQSAPVHPWSMAPSSFASSNSGHRKDCLGCSCSCLLLTCTTIFERLAERYSIRSEEGNKSQCSCDVVLFVWAGFLSRQHSLVHSPIQKACKKLRCPNSRFSLPPRTSLARQGLQGSASVRYVQTPKDGNANEETLWPLVFPSGLQLLDPPAIKTAP